jgi:ABC-2 type transport system permease protein
MIAFLAVLRKEFLQIFRDKRMLPLLLVAPIIQLLVFGYAVNFDVNHIETMVCDFDRTPYSRDLAQRLAADGTFRISQQAHDCTRPELEIFTSRSQMVVIIPPKTSALLLSGESVTIQAIVDGTNPIIGRFAAQSVTSFFQHVSMPWLSGRRQTLESRTQTALKNSYIKTEPRVFFNPEMKSSIFMVPGVAVLILLVITMVATSMGLAREREMGTLEQVIVTPIGRFSFLFGKVLPFVIFGLIDILAVLVLSMAVFEVPIRGSLVLYFFGTFLYLLNTVGLGLFVSTISKSQQQALLTGFFLLIPAMLLSGILTPIAAMPQWLQPVTYLNPLRYFGEILRSVMLKGADFWDLAPSFLGLGAFGIAIFGIATMRFSKHL